MSLAEVCLGWCRHVKDEKNLFRLHIIILLSSTSSFGKRKIIWKFILSFSFCYVDTNMMKNRLRNKMKHTTEMCSKIKQNIPINNHNLIVREINLFIFKFSATKKCFYAN